MSETIITGATATEPAGREPAPAPDAAARVAELEAELAATRAELAEAKALLGILAVEWQAFRRQRDELQRRLAAFGAALTRFELAEAPPASPSVN
jgi:chromosome segregation ATPase